MNSLNVYILIRYILTYRKHKEVKTMEEGKEKEDVIRLARLFDNRGTIGIRKREPRKDWRDVNYSYSTMFKFSSRNESLIEWIVETFGSKVHKWDNGKRFTWLPTKDELMPILLQIHPFLIQKKSHVSCLMSFINDCKKDSRQYHYGPYMPLPPSVVELREKYYLEMKELNKK